MPKLLIVISGGVLSGLYSDMDIEVKVIDMDEMESEGVEKDYFEKAGFSLDTQDPEGYEAGIAEVKTEVEELRKEQQDAGEI